MSPVCAAAGGVVFQSDRVASLVPSVLLSRLELLPAAATTLDCLPACLRAPVSPINPPVAVLSVSPVPPVRSPYPCCSPLLTSITVPSHTRRGVVLFNLAQPCRSVQYKPRPQHTHAHQPADALLSSSQHNILPLTRSFPISPFSRRTNADLAPTHATV